MLIAIGVVAAAATTAGCGGKEVDKTGPCKDIQQEIQHLVQAAGNQAQDPAALSKTLKDSATKIRNEGAPVGGQVQQGSDDAARALEQLGDRLATGTPPQQSEMAPLLAPLLDAGAKIRAACAPSSS